MFSLEGILSYLKKEFTKTDICLLITIIFLYLLTRLINLDHWPIFSDEGIYIRWAKVAWKDASWRFISVTDGRQPLQTWATIPFLKLFPENMLFAGRLFSVTTGFIALSGMVSALTYLWGKRAGRIGGMLYVFLPYVLFYDRMALVDSAVNAGFIWIFFFSIYLARLRRLDTALILGFIGGFALLAKSSSRMFLMLAGLAPIMFLNEKRKIISHAINYWILLGIAIAISLLFYNVQRLSPFFQYVAEKNTTFIMTTDELFATPFAFLLGNLRDLPLYVSWESGWFIVLVSLIGFYFLYKKERMLFLYFLAVTIIPYIGISFIAKVLFPRYVLFYGSILVITATYAIMQLKSTVRTIAFSLLLVTMLFFDYPLLFDPVRASFPPVDRGQYVEGLTAVWGAQDLVSSLREESKQQPILVLAEGDFGLVADVLKVFVHDTDAIEIKGLWPLDEEDILEYLPETQKRPVYVVFSHRTQFPENWPITLVKSYPKPQSDNALYLFKYVTPRE